MHPDVKVRKRLIPVAPELRVLALQVGQLFGLDIYGLDVVETTYGPVIVDINDFPSFGHVPGAVTLVSTYILHVARRVQLQRLGVADILQPLDKQLRTTAQPIAEMYP